MEALGLAFIFLGFMCAIPVFYSMKGVRRFWGADFKDARSKVEDRQCTGWHIRDIEHQTWKVRLFQLGGAFCTVGVVLTLLSLF